MNYKLCFLQNTKKINQQCRYINFCKKCFACKRMKDNVNHRQVEQADQDILRSARQVRIQPPLQLQLSHFPHQLLQKGVAGSLQHRSRYNAQVSR